MTVLPEAAPVEVAYRAAREDRAHRFEMPAVIDVEGPDREAFLQGQLTQDVRDLAAGRVRPAAALTPRGKLLYIARLLGLGDRFRLVLPGGLRLPALEHLRKFAAFQKVSVSDRSDALAVVRLYGPGWRDGAADLEAGWVELPEFGEIAAEWLVPSDALERVGARLASAGSVEIDAGTAEVLRIEAGRPCFGRDIDGTNLPDEAGLEAAVSATKGCYVGQEVVARRRTYGRANRRLVGFRFPGGCLGAGQSLRRAAAASGPERTEAGRVTSVAVSPRFGAIGLGFAFHDVALGERLFGPGDSPRAAVVSALPFA